VTALVGFAVLVTRGLLPPCARAKSVASVLVVSIISSIMFHVAVNVSMTLGLAR
jgi:cell division protein FtsW (lipid II flippase)